MNTEKLKKLEAEVRIGGKGTVRRKKKTVRTNTSGRQAEEKAQMKKIAFQPVPNVAEAMFFMNDGSGLKIDRPAVQVCFSGNTTAINGIAKALTKEQIAEGDGAADLIDIFSALNMNTNKIGF